MLKDKKRFTFQLIDPLFRFYRHLCTSVLGMLPSHEDQHFSAPVAASQKLSDTMSTEDTNPLWVTKLSPVIIIYSFEYMQMVRMSKLPLLKWLVWIADNAGEFVKAHKVVDGSDYVSFYLELSDRDVLVKQYHKSEINSGGYKLVA